MRIRAVLRVAVSLLVAAVQVAGAAIATPSASSPEEGLYFCCCVGECSCTGDCCNHEPTTTGDHRSPVIRIGAAGPVLEAPKSCGVWRATLQRGPDHGKLIAADTGVRAPAAPPSPLPSLIRQIPAVPIDSGLQPCSPRAPPSTRIRT